MPFNFIETEINDLLLIEPRVFTDDRGFFMETYKESDFRAAGITENFVQDNHSMSGKGVLRGLHYQTEPHAQGKIVRVVQGAVWDVGVDLRADSTTFKRWFAAVLSAENHRMMYIPPGFAHGFLTLEDDTHFLYKCTAEYNAGADGGIRWDDPDIRVDWPLEPDQVPDVSEKDVKLPYFREIS